MNKDIDVGGTSDAGDIPYLVEIFKILNPRTVLDIGTGCYGKNAYILRQYVEHKFRHLYGVKSIIIHGVEAYQKNYDYARSLNLYDWIYCKEILHYLNEYVIKYHSQRSHGFDTKPFQWLDYIHFHKYPAWHPAGLSFYKGYGQISISGPAGNI